MKTLRFFILILVVNFIVIVFPASISSAETSKKSEIDIDVSPEDSLFNVQNMKPGDWAPRSITILNNGKMDFEYSIQLQNNGAQKLFNELLLEINDYHTELFNGKLAEFMTLSPRELTAGSEEELKFTVRFPEHLGNDFQGLDTHFTLIFTARGDQEKIDVVSVDGAVGSDEDLPKSGSILPSTATNIFNYLVIGGLLLVFGGLLAIYNKTIRKDSSRNS